MHSFPNFEPVCCSTANSNCCFLTCLQVFREAGTVIWYSHLFKNFPVCGIHTAKGFNVINEAEVDVLLEFSCFFYDPTDAGNLISGSSAFSKSTWTSGSSQFTYCWRLGEFWALLCWHVRWVQLCGSLSVLWHCLSLGLKWKHLFQSCGHCWVFQICWYIECSTFTASSFRIWNSSAGILSPPLALFVVLLPKAHLTSYSRMFGSRWVITPLRLSGSWWSFL